MPNAPSAESALPNRIIRSVPKRPASRPAKLALTAKKAMPATCMITKSVNEPPSETVITTGAPNTKVSRPPRVKACDRA